MIHLNRRKTGQIGWFVKGVSYKRKQSAHCMHTVGVFFRNRNIAYLFRLISGNPF